MVDIRKINHIGIVVTDFEEGKNKFGTLLGLEHMHDEDSSEYNCKIGFFRCGDVMIEIVTPTGPGPSKDFLETQGEGIHHICYEVTDIEATLETAKKYFTTDYDKPKIGAGESKVIFVEKASLCGVETEFVELKK